MTARRLGRIATWGAALLSLSVALSGCAALQSLASLGPREAPAAPTAPVVPPEPERTAPANSSTSPNMSAPSGATSTVTSVNVDTTLSGRLSLRVRKTLDGSTDGGSLLFDFQGRESQGRLTLQTPIGTALAQVVWGPDGAEVITPQGRRKGPTLDGVASVLLGETLPIAALLRWIQAEPWEGAPFTAQADGFEQLGWTISLAAWNESVVTAHRPARTDRTHDTEILVRARLDTKPGGAAPFHSMQP